MLECPAAAREVIFKAILGELNKCAPTNRLYGYAATPLMATNGMNADMDKFINTTYLYATVKADEVGQNVISTLPYVVPQLCQAKVVTMAMRQPDVKKHLTPEEIVWIDDKTKVAESIQSSVELWISRNPDRIKKPGATSTGEQAFKRAIPRKVQPLFSAPSDNVVINGAVPITENITQTAQYDANGVFITRPVGASKFRKSIDPLSEVQSTGYKTKAPVRRFGAAPQIKNELVQPEPTVVQHAEGFDPAPPIKRGFSAIPPRQKTWLQDEPLPEVTQQAPLQQSQFSATQEKQKETQVMNTALHIVSAPAFQENPLKYEHHQLYKSFGIKPQRTAEQTRAEFMGALDHIKLTPQTAYQELIAGEAKPEITFLWHEQINSAMCMEHSLVRTATGLIEADFTPGIDGHYAYNFDRYEAIKTFTDKSVLDLFMDEHPLLARLFDLDFARFANPVGLGLIHESLKSIAKDTAVSTIVELLNLRITKMINYALKYDLLSTYRIDDFIEDFDDLVSAMVKALNNEEVATQMRGEANDETSPGVYLAKNTANLVYNLPADVVKQWNQVINTTKKDMASRSLFLVERHCVCSVSASFTSNIAVSAIPNKWSEFRQDASPELWALLEMLVNQQPHGGHLQVAKFHLVFNDGIVVEAKPTALSLNDAPDLSGEPAPRVFLARILDPQDF